MTPGVLAATLASRIYPRLSGTPVLVMGEDELAEQFARHFAAYGAKVLFLHQGDTLENEFHRHDVVACFGTPGPIRRAAVEKAVRARKRRPILLLDLGHPPSVEPDVGELDDVFLYTLKDLYQA